MKFASKFAITLVLGCALLAGACSGTSTSSSPTAPSTQPAAGSVPFSITELRAGSGATAATGRQVQVRYTGWLYSTSAADNKGTQFDSGTLPFTVGSGVIAGFSQGVTGMQVGAIRRVVIPPSLGYGAAGSPPRIPGNATLIFEIELLSVS